MGNKTKTPNGAPQRFYRGVIMTYDGDECLRWPYAKNPVRSRSGGAALMRVAGRLQLVSRRVCAEVNGPPPTPEHEAAHKCGNGHEACVTKRHLTWKTHTENMADKVAHGTHNRGERQHFSKITEAQAREILSLKGVVSQSRIAARFGVTNVTVCRIHGGKAWAWLQEG